MSSPFLCVFCGAALSENDSICEKCETQEKCEIQEKCETQEKCENGNTEASYFGKLAYRQIDI